jgi:hypothetical protein
MVRIATTPSPFVYRHLVVLLTFIFVFTFPLGFITILGTAVIPFTAFTALGFYGVLHLSKELENPYGFDFNDIDLSLFQRQLHEELITIYTCAFGHVPTLPDWTPLSAHMSAAQSTNAREGRSSTARNSTARVSAAGSNGVRRRVVGAVSPLETQTVATTSPV